MAAACGLMASLLAFADADPTHREYCPSIERQTRQFQFQIHPDDRKCFRPVSKHQQDWQGFHKSFLEYCRDFQKERPIPGKITRILTETRNQAAKGIKAELGEMGSEFQQTNARVATLGNAAVKHAQQRIEAEVTTPFQKLTDRYSGLEKNYRELLPLYPDCSSQPAIRDANRRMFNHIRQFYDARLKEVAKRIEGDHAMLEQEKAQAKANGVQLASVTSQSVGNDKRMMALTGASAMPGAAAVAQPPPPAAKPPTDRPPAISGTPTAATTTVAPTPPAATGATGAAEALFGNVNNARAGQSDIAKDAALLAKAEGGAEGALVKVFQARNYNGTGGDNTLASRLYVESVLQRPVSDDDLKMLDRYLFSQDITERYSVVGAGAAAVATVPYEGMKFVCQNMLGGTDVVGYWAGKVGAQMSCTGTRFQAGAIGNTFRGIGAGFTQ